MTDVIGAAAGEEQVDGRSTAPLNGSNGHVNGRRKRIPTTTSRFGVSKRENHDSSAFYERFPQPEIIDDETLNPPAALDRIWVGDARDMDRFGEIADASVALVVTSPPYFAGKAYEEAIGEGHIPESYIAYLQMLRDVFAECKRKLQPGGRIAVNVANLGRKPYRSLSADVIAILQDDLRFLVRGEIVWVKGKAAGGSCAWGSFQQPGSPTLRDVSERIIVASNGRFNRAIPARKREARDLPSVSTITADEFMDLTTDVWELPPESAIRVGHPAPFPVELPRRLIDLYTYEGELVLDPFMGAGSTAVAAMRTGRHYAGFDTDAGYVAKAEARIADERERLADGGSAATWERPHITLGVEESTTLDHALAHGRKVKDVAKLALKEAGFGEVVVNERNNIRPVAGVDIDLLARDQQGNQWHVLLAGSFSASNPGLRRIDTMWRTLGRASALGPVDTVSRVVVLTTDMPTNTTARRTLMSVVGCEPGKTIVDVIRLDDPDDLARLAVHAKDG